MQPGCQAQQLGQQVEPLLARQPQVEERDIEQPMAEQLQCLGGISGLGDAMAHRFQRGAQRPAQAGLVIDDEDVHGMVPVASCILRNRGGKTQDSPPLGTDTPDVTV